MLNPIEERILKKLVESDDPQHGVSLHFDDIDSGYVYGAVNSLARKGLVKNSSDLSSASAFITTEGRYYFEMEEREKYGEYYDSIKLIEAQIVKAEELYKSTDTSELEDFIQRTFIAFCDTSNDDLICGFRTTFGLSSSKDIKDFRSDLGYLIILLQKVIGNQKIEAQKAKTERAKIEIHNNNNPTITNENNITTNISLSNTIENIEKHTNLSPEEQEELNKLLMEIETCKKKKDKKTLWEKSKTAIKWIVEKGIEVGIAVLPYIIQSLTP